MRNRLAVTVLVATAFALPAPVQADESVGLFVYYWGTPVGSAATGVGKLTCVGAAEHLSTLQDVPVLTSVSCTLAGRTTTTTAYGAAAAANVVNTLTVPFTICAKVWGAFVDPSSHRAYVVFDELCTERRVI